MITSRAEDIRVDSLANVTLQWRAIGFQDERKPEIAEGALSSGSSSSDSSSGTSRLKDLTGGIANKLRNFGF